MELIARSFDIIYQLDWIGSVNVIKTTEHDIYMFGKIKNIYEYVKLIDEIAKERIYSTDSVLANFQTEVKAFDSYDSKHRIIKFIGEHINSKYKIYPFDIDFNSTVIINIKNTNTNKNYVLVTGGPGIIQK